MISKELLSVVLDIPLQHIRYNGTTNHYKIFKENLFKWNSGDYGRWSNLEINIYELAHKCKEWALNQGYVLESLINRSCIIGSNYEYFASVKIHKETDSSVQENIDVDTEPEAIFKACQWILDKELA